MALETKQTKLSLNDKRFDTIKSVLEHCGKIDCSGCPYRNRELDYCHTISEYIWLLEEEKQLAETRFKDILSALYRQTSEEKRGDFTANQGITLYRKDIVELAKDYGIKEDELK